MPILLRPAPSDATVPTETHDLTPFAQAARAAGRLGIDTEFMGERRYRALLCLVQVVVPDPDATDGQRIVLLDPLDGFDPAPLAEVLADPAVEVVLHAGRQDVAILRRAWRTEVRNIFDTQVSAGFAGFSAQAGYGTLLNDALGLRVGKSATFTRWDARPLTDEQLAYAREDVIHLLELSTVLQRRLAERGRLEWAHEECRALEQATDERDPETAYLRLPRQDQMRARERTVARELAAWRERTASAEDRPVNTILPDQALVECARRRPGSRRELEEIRGLHGGIVSRHGREITDAIARGLAADPIPAPERRPGLDLADTPLISLAEALIRARAVQAGLAYELLASRAELNAIVGASRRGEPEPDVRTLAGWRRELVGTELLELLDGHHALAVDVAGGLRVQPAAPPPT